MSPTSCGSVQLQALLHHGCVKVKVTDPRRVSRERERCARFGLRLGSEVNTAYRRPWLYVTLAARVRDPGQLLSAETVARPRSD
jgi:hypothetical protein